MVKTRRAERRFSRVAGWERLESRVLLSTWVDTSDRAAVVRFYQSDYLSSNGVPAGWTGSMVTGNPGTTSAAFQAAVLRRVNYYRAMAGVPALMGWDPVYSAKAQAAALMMSANGALNHSPPTTWKFYTAAGAEAAASSNLAMSYGPQAINDYMGDAGGGNTAAGHRRWVLYPQTQVMGTGDIPGGAGYGANNALWVFDTAHMWGPRPMTRQAYVSWPNPGYVPYQVITPRWSFSYGGADMSHAKVTLVRNGVPVAVTVYPVVNGYGENTVVWDVPGTITAADTWYTVTVSNVVIGGVARTFTYGVTTIDGNVGTVTPPPPSAEDKTAPTPYVSNWTVFPHAISSSSIQMTATTANDPSGVQYYFHNLTVAGHDSGWQSSPTYTDTGLLPNTNYGYEVRTRDGLGNTGAYSSSAGAATQAVKVSTPKPVSKKPLSFFDEGYYLQNNPDVAAAIVRRAITSAWAHFMRYGQFEKRRPSVLFNEAFYLAANPDVAWAVKVGLFKTGFQHFVAYGFAEGRRGA